MSLAVAPSESTLNDCVRYVKRLPASEPVGPGVAAICAAVWPLSVAASVAGPGVAAIAAAVRPCSLCAFAATFALSAVSARLASGSGVLRPTRTGERDEEREHGDDKRRRHTEPPETEPTHLVLLSFVSRHRYDTLAQMAQTEPLAGTLLPLSAKILMNQPVPSGIGRSAMMSARPSA